jgi:hypothetical protein
MSQHGTPVRQRPFNRILFTYAWVIGIGLVIVIAHTLSRSKANAPYAGGVLQLPLAAQSSSAAVAAGASAQPGSPTDSAADATPITASTPLHVGGGVPVYSTNFVQSDQVFSGWPLGPQQNVDIELHPNGYAITGAGRYISLVDAPVDQQYNQIEVSAHALESTNPPPGAAFGVFCALGGVAYAFDVDVDGTWSIRRGAAPEIFETRDTSIAIAHGPAGRSPAADTAIVGVCATLPGGTSVRLAMFVNGAKVADLLDTQAADGIGWRAGIVSTDADLSSSTTTFVSFAETAFGISDRPTPTQLPSPADSFGVQT